jgi:hypothetical protein
MALLALAVCFVPTKHILSINWRSEMTSDSFGFWLVHEAASV